MSAVGTLAALLFLSVGPDGWQVEARHQQADALEHRLVPMEWLGDTPRGLWIAVHPDPGRSALFVAPGSREAQIARLSLAADELPPPDAPFVLLDREVHLQPAAGGVARWRPVEGLPLDVAEHYYRALLDAHAAIRRSNDAAWTTALAERAEGAMPRVPAEHRAAAFREAALEFASHVLSVAHEIGRHVRRRPPGALCGALGHPATLFGTWSRAHGDAPFVGGWWQPADAETGAAGTWRLSPDPLRPADKRWVVRDLLETDWTGDPGTDFAYLCSYRDP